MGKEQDHHVSDRKTLLYIMGVACVAGIAAVIIGILGWNSENLTNVDKLVKFNLLGSGGGFCLTVHKCMLATLICGIVAILSSAGGAYGAQNQHKGLMCQYLTTTVILGMVMLFLGVHALNRQTEVESIVNGQIQDLCRKEDYIRYTQNIPCDGAVPAGQQAVECGDVCQVKIQNLKAVNACSYLPRLCREFVYSSAPETFALPATASFFKSNDVTVTADDASCQTVCNQDVTCVGYALADSTCTVASDNWDSRYTAEGTIYTANPGFSATALRVKGNPYVLDSFQRHGEHMACAILLLALIMLVAAFFTWKVMYNQVLDKEGKPSAGHICRMLCCCPVNKKEYRGPIPEEEAILSS